MNKLAAEDSAIIVRFQRGDRIAFDELVRRHRQRAYQFAYRLTKNSDEAADIVADAFIRVFRALDGFKGDSSFTTWLFRIETNCFLDIRKRSHSKQIVSIEELNGVQSEHGSNQLADESEPVQQQIERSERISVIEQAMLSLPEHQRAILLMYHAESMSYEDIAECLRLPLGTVKSRINRARLNLRTALHPYRRLFITRSTRKILLAGV
ncbi:MAG: sigma-70 family RNA polymerase sigma factor [Fimbriimonas sp.]|nr:sigma-70 family RNA polymerase sigma factor [Fimbriimonas sp.]